MTANQINALSDRYGQIYAIEQLVLSVGQEGQRYHVLVVEGEQPPRAPIREVGGGPAAD